MFSHAQMFPPGFQEALQRFEGWLIQRIQQPGVLERFQLEVKYRASSSPWLDEFCSEAVNRLAQEFEGPVPLNILEQLKSGFFLKHYVRDWLLSQPLVGDIPHHNTPPEAGSDQGKSQTYVTTKYHILNCPEMRVRAQKCGQLSQT